MVTGRQRDLPLHKHMFTISKQFTFSASHVLDMLPDDHQCARLHGHNYIVEVVLEAEGLNEFGFVKDYLALSELKNYIDESLDHRHLNDVFDFPTTAENIALFLYNWSHKRWPQVVAMRVSETPKTWAEYRP